MKFVCDACNAKYQIGDDKVAGKTLRMKCRRCGNMIQVAATVTESSVSQKLPSEPAAGSVPAMGALESSGEDGATIVRPSPLFLFQKEGGAPAASAAPAPGGVPRPGAAPRIVPPARASMRGSSPQIDPSGVAAIPAAAPSAPAHSPSAPGLYGGFAKAVAAPAPKAASTPLPTEDWYVGIAGVPLGPVRLAVVREKATLGQVDADSLVWREGFDEWLPIKNFPALLGMIEEAAHARVSRTSLPVTPIPAPAGQPFTPLGTGPSAPVARTSSPSPAAPVRPQPNPFASGTPAGALAEAARAFATSAAPSAVPSPRISTLGSASPGATDLIERPAIPEAAPSIPFDLVQPAGASAPSPAGAAPLADPFALKDPFGSANGSTKEGASTAMGYGLTTTAAVAGPSPPVSSLDASTREVGRASVPPPKKKGIHPAVWAFIAMATAFGGVAAWALFLRNPNVVYVNQPGAAATTSQPVGAAPPPPPTGEATADATSTTEPTAQASGGPVAGPTGGKVGNLGTATSTKPGETAAPIDTSGFGGTTSGPATASTSSGGGGPLNEAQLNGVVSSNSPRVRRKCWDPLVAGRSSDAPSSVKVTATVKINPNGSVKSVGVSGGNEKHYPGLTSCVQSTVSAWSFPTSSEGGTVVVPFGFNAQ